MSLAEKLQRALGLHQQGQAQQAQAIYQEILRIEPHHSEALQLLGLIAAQDGKLHLAAELMGKAIESDPRNVAAYCNRATVFKSLGQLSVALESYDRAIELAPDLATVHFNRGLVLQELQQLAAALASYEQAIAIEPDYAEAHLACGNVLNELNQLDAALTSCDRAIALVDDYEDAHVGRGALLLVLGRLDAARASYDRAIALKPDCAMAHYGRSFTSLLSGDFETGWSDYEWRWQDSKCLCGREKRDFTQPLWLGEESLAGKKILLYSEQGLGDTLQFCRYASLVADLGAEVILEVQQPLRSLLDGLEGVSLLVARGDALPDFDYRCPLLSLPLAFKTTVATIPARVPYLKSHPEKSLFWRDMLGSPSRKRVGLVWAGGFRPDQPSMNARRNIALAKFAALNQVDVEFFSVQKGQPAESELAALVAKGWNGPKVLDFTHLLRDFSDTAALIDQLDLLIAVDTSTAHLAAAMGKPVWILNRFDTCWRWMLDRTDSPWYPTVTIYRQPKPGDWDSVIANVLRDLKQR